MGELNQHTWIILLTTRPKRGKSNIEYITNKSLLYTQKKPPNKWDGPVPDKDFAEFANRDEAETFAKNRVNKWKYCVTICPSFKRPNLVRDRKEWAKSWQQVLWKHAPETSSCGQPRRRKRRSGAVAARRTVKPVRPADAGLGSVS